MKKHYKAVEKIADNKHIDMLDVLEDLDWSTSDTKSPKLIIKKDSEGNELGTAVFNPEDANKVINCVMDDADNGEDIDTISIGNFVKNSDNDIEFKKDFVLKKNNCPPDADECVKQSCKAYPYLRELLPGPELVPVKLDDISTINEPSDISPTINIPSDTPININLKVENMTVNINMVDPNK